MSGNLFHLHRGILSYLSSLPVANVDSFHFQPQQEGRRVDHIQHGTPFGRSAGNFSKKKAFQEEEKRLQVVDTDGLLVLGLLDVKHRLVPEVVGGYDPAGLKCTGARIRERDQPSSRPSCLGGRRCPRCSVRSSPTHGPWHGWPSSRICSSRGPTSGWCALSLGGVLP